LRWCCRANSGIRTYRAAALEVSMQADSTGTFGKALFPLCIDSHARSEGRALINGSQLTILAMELVLLLAQTTGSNALNTYALNGFIWPILFGLIILMIWFFRRRRTESLTNVAHQLGLTFEGDDWGPRNPGPQLKSRHFRGELLDRFSNIMSGERAGFAASFFDHTKTGRGGGHSDTVATFTQNVSLPEFALAPQDIFYKVGNAIAHQEIDFASDPVFSARFRLVGADEERVRELFTPDMLAFIGSIEPTWHIEGSGCTLILYCYQYTVKPAEFADFVEETTQIARDFFSHCHLRKPAF